MMLPTVPAACVADTHATVWTLSSWAHLQRAAVAALRAAEVSHAPIYISAITIVEIRYLIEKGKLIELDYQHCIQALLDPAMMLTMAPLDLNIADQPQQIPRAAVPDMPDRIIAATALALGLPLATADTDIRLLTNITTIW